MPGYNRVRGITWPVTFRVDDGHRFTIPPPIDDPTGRVLRCHVEGGRAGEYEIGPWCNEQSAGAIIGRTIRWWIERTGVGVSIDRRRVQ
jgi:hypothetical protein